MPPPAFTLTMTASGDVSDYTEVVVEAIAVAVALNVGVDRERVKVEVMPGSVIIVVTIQAADATDVSVNQTSLTTSLGDSLASLAEPDAATEWLANITEVAALNVTVGSVVLTDPGSLSQSSDGKTQIPFAVWVVLPIAAIIACLCALGAAAGLYKQEREPKFTRHKSKGMPNATQAAMEILADKVAADKDKSNMHATSHHLASKASEQHI